MDFRADDVVEIAGLKVRTELNGLSATIVDWDASEERWRVRMQDGTGKMLRPEHLVLVKRGREPSPPRLASTWTPPLEAPGGYKTSLAPGDHVRVKKKEDPFIDGEEGVVVRWEPDLHQWKVRLDVTGECHFFAASSVELKDWPPPGPKQSKFVPPVFKEGDHVRVRGLQARPDLNGELGEVTGFDAAEERWQVVLESGTGKLLKTSNLELVKAAEEPPAGRTLREPAAQPETPPCFAGGARVVVHGLQIRPDLNGKLGHIVTWDTAEHRYKVMLDDGTGKMLRPTNLRKATSADEASSPPPEASGLGEGDQQCWKVLSDNGNGTLTREEHLPGDELPDAQEEAKSPARSDRPLAKGDRVRVCYLKDRTELNGWCGELVGWDSVEQRWKVALEDGTGKLLKEANLQLASPRKTKPVANEPIELTAARQAQLYPGRRVRCKGLQIQQELNGCVGTIVAWDRAEERWKVRFENGEGKLLHASKLFPLGNECDEGPAIAMGVRVKLVGIRGTPELNDKCGTVQAWDAADERWQVLLDAGTVKAVRHVNLMIIHDEPTLDNNNRYTVDPPTYSETKPTAPSQPPPAAPDRPTPATASRSVPSQRSPPPAGAAPEPSPPVATSQSSAPSRPAAPVRLGPGSRVLVSSKNKPEMDGRVGTALEWIEAIERWKVVLDDGASLLALVDSISALSCGWDSKSAQMLD